MNKHEFINFALNDFNIPLFTKSGKDMMITISEGYREAGWSANGYSKMVKTLFPDKPAGTTIFNYLLKVYDSGYCNFCDTVSESDNFLKKLREGKTGLQSNCRDCAYTYKKAKQGNELMAYYSSIRRAKQLQATPPWANLDKIKEIYKNCPEGYHVDHIFPLQGINSCGLHVENNLQYLLAEDNLRKSNKIITGP